MTRSDEFWEIAIAANAVIKGLLGSMGESGHICQRAIPIRANLNPEDGFATLAAAFVSISADEITDGDVVVVPDKLVAIAEGRFGPLGILTDPDPKTIGAAERDVLARDWSAKCGFVVEPLHLLLADEYEHPEHGKVASLGTLDHNRAAADIAHEFVTRTERRIDVVISDTDTGLDVREPLIGTLTLGATPLGATAGLNLYEAMRCACAAEFVRGHFRQIPVVICRPAERRRSRKRIGLPRGYGGALRAEREPGLTYA